MGYIKEACIELDKEYNQIDYCNIGKVGITNGYNLKEKYIIDRLALFIRVSCLLSERSNVCTKK